MQGKHRLEEETVKRENRKGSGDTAKEVNKKTRR